MGGPPVLYDKVGYPPLSFFGRFLPRLGPCHVHGLLFPKFGRFAPADGGQVKTQFPAPLRQAVPLPWWSTPSSEALESKSRQILPLSSR